MAGRKRDAHRGVVQKRIRELETILTEAEGNEEGPDLNRLRRLMLNLQEKMEVLSRLDEEVLDGLNDAEAMGRDIEEADEFRQTIHGAIEKADTVLASSSVPGPAHSAPATKLPELLLSKFDGDVTTWHSFWDSYESAVHNNASLSDVNKFTYLKSLVLKSAKDAIEGLALKAANYEEAVAILKKRFGNQHLINPNIWRN